MISPRYLTKSRFKSGLECSTKLFYTKKDQYPDNKLNDQFLATLAKGGFQVGELAKCYFPGGINIEELDYETSLSKTNALLQQENVIIYEAAFLYKTLFIRADVLVKKGKTIFLYEVKAKSADSADEVMVKKDGLPKSDWEPYLCDIAFQKHVVTNAMPGHTVKAFLMVADKSTTATVDGLNQKFLLGLDSHGKTKVDIVGDIGSVELGAPLLCAIPVDGFIDRIYAEPVFHVETSSSFKDLIALLAGHYERDERLQATLTANCKKCEFKASEIDEVSGLSSGFKECWTRVNKFTAADFLKPSVLDIWNYRGKDKFISEGRFFQSDIIPEDLLPKTAKKTTAVEPGMTSTDRQIMQIAKSKDNDTSVYLDINGLRDVFKTFIYPLHFIDFETTAVAIPFHKGRRPYEQIAFQFSHHIVYENGDIIHQGEWINTEQGKFPNFDFVRKLKQELCDDSGTIFRYAAHENSILNAIYKQLKDSSENDRVELCSWIQTITKSTGSSVESWQGERNMVDLLELVKKYYYAPQTNGSNSIKYILPAILNSSDYLKRKYSQPIYGQSIKSLNFSGQAWIVMDKNNQVINPYHLLSPIFEGVDTELLDEMLTHEEGEIRDGGAAMMAYAQMQFTQMGQMERQLIQQSLLKYCELDTLAMVMIWEEWSNKLK